MGYIARHNMTHSNDKATVYNGVVSTMKQQFKGLCSDTAIESYVRDIANHIGLPGYIELFWDEINQCWVQDVAVDIKTFVNAA